LALLWLGDWRETVFTIGQRRAAGNSLGRCGPISISVARIVGIRQVLFLWPFFVQEKHRLKNVEEILKVRRASMLALNSLLESG